MPDRPGHLRVDLGSIHNLDAKAGLPGYPISVLSTRKRAESKAHGSCLRPNSRSYRFVKFQYILRYIKDPFWVTIYFFQLRRRPGDLGPRSPAVSTRTKLSDPGSWVWRSCRARPHCLQDQHDNMTGSTIRRSDDRACGPSISDRSIDLT